MTSEEAAEVARLGSDINSLAPPNKEEGTHLRVLFFVWWTNATPLAPRARIGVRIRRSEIDTLACQTESAGIFAVGELPR